MAQHNISGTKAEAMACEYLHSKGFSIIQQNYKDRFCEIDIVAKDKTTLVFVEVKYRRRADFGGAIGAITYDKFTRMHNSAQYWLAQNDDYTQLQPRLDVITIVGDMGQPTIEHLENIEY